MSENEAGHLRAQEERLAELYNRLYHTSRFEYEEIAVLECRIRDLENVICNKRDGIE